MIFHEPGCVKTTWSERPRPINWEGTNNDHGGRIGMNLVNTAPQANGFVEEVELQGHIIDSLLLPKVLDEILTRGGNFELKEIRVGKRQADPSYVRISVRAPKQDLLQDILGAIHDHGAVPVATA